MPVESLGWEDHLEKGRATHSSILAWIILWTEESAPPRKDLALPSLHISQHPTRARGPGSGGLGLTEHPYNAHGRHSPPPNEELPGLKCQRCRY